MLVSLALLAMSAPQGARVPSVVFPVSGSLPNGEIISIAQPPTVNERGGFASVVFMSDGRSAIWGTLDRTPPRILLRDRDLPDGYRLNMVALGADSITYYARAIVGSSALCDRGIIERDGAGVDCLERTMLSVPGSSLATVSQIAVPSRGVGRYVLEYFAPPITWVERYALVTEGDPVPSLLPGDSIVGATGAITSVQGLSLSPTGAHYGCRVVLDSGGGDYAIVDGAVLQNQGVNVQSGMLVDPAGPAGGPTWFRIFEAAKASSGDWWVYGGDNPATPNQTFLMKSGEIVLRRGDVVEGETITGLRGGLKLTEGGTAACLVTLGGGASPDMAVWYQNQLVVKVGQAVDTDGDGVAEPDRTIERVVGLSVVDADHVVWSQVAITEPGNRTVFVAVPMPFGDPVCPGEPNSTGLSASAEAVGTQLIGENDLQLTARSLPANAMGLWVTSHQSGFLPNPGGSAGNLCLGGAIGRFAEQIAMASSAGELGLAVNLANLPDPSGRVSAQPGETRSFQLWYRDVDSQGAATSNFSAAIAVHAR